MARPTKPKDLKPKEAELAAVPGGAAPSASGSDTKLLLAAIVVIGLLGPILTVGGIYGLAEFVIVPAIVQKVGAPEHGEEGAHGQEAHVAAVGMNLELDEFTVNLKPDVGSNANPYLRAKMALSIQVPPEEDCYATHALLPGGGKIVGAAAPIDTQTLAAGGGGGPSCEDIFKNNMSKYVPTIRDIINGALMKQMVGRLSSQEGLEALKDEIKSEVDAVMAPRYQVIRVNFQDFIIQK